MQNRNMENFRLVSYIKQMGYIMKEQLLKAVEKFSIEVDKHIALRLILLVPVLLIAFLVIVGFSLAFFVAVAYLILKEVFWWIAGYPETDTCCCEDCT